MKIRTKKWCVFFLISISFTTLYLHDSLFTYSSIDFEKYKPFVILLMIIGGTGTIDRAYILFTKKEHNSFFKTKTSLFIIAALLIFSLMIAKYIYNNINLTHANIILWPDNFIYIFLVSMGIIYITTSIYEFIVSFLARPSKQKTND